MSSPGSASPPTSVWRVGVDRFDYTKGILERLHALERLLEKHPEWIGKLTLVQVAAPTRSSLEEYRSFQERIERLCERIDAALRQGRVPAGDPARRSITTTRRSTSCTALPMSAW